MHMVTNRNLTTQGNRHVPQTPHRRDRRLDPPDPFRRQAGAVDAGKGQGPRDWDVELVDIRDFDLPFFDEMASNLWMPSKNPNAVKWQQKIGSFDGYMFVIAEYNRSIPASLKNALDQAYKEWNHKPMAAMGYGPTGGGARGRASAHHRRRVADGAGAFGVHLVRRRLL